MHLPHVADRPLSLVRCPNGAGSGCFFQKHAWAGLSDRILRRVVTDESGDEEEILYIQDLGGLLALVQASVLEIHPWGAPIDDPDRPDRITMDLDPGEEVAFAEVVTAALDVKERLASQGAVAVGNSSAEFQAYVKSEIERWGQLIATTGIKIK